MVEAVQQVGVARSGKAIQSPMFGDENELNLPAASVSYTPADHFDAHAVFEYLISRELGRGSADARALDTYKYMSDEHKLKIGSKAVEVERLALCLPTVFDILEHGKGLADSVFKE